jgi:hypothetical protein
MPLEIDIHFKCYTFEPWDVESDVLGYCDLCNFRIDGFGYCAYGCLPTSLLFDHLGEDV